MASFRNLLFVGLLGALFACAEPSPNILLIVVDTLRADHLSCYGSERLTSPAIDALAAEGVLFTRAYATGPWTKPSIASIFTGLYPSAHGVESIARRLPEHLPTLAQVLRSQGYATAGVVSHTLIGSRYGFERGFETYLESESQGAAHLSSEGVTRQAIGLLEEFDAGDRPFFLFVHYFDPHYTYRRHPEYGFAARGAGRLRGEESVRVLRRYGTSMSPEELALIRAIYDEEVRFTDAGIGRLLEALRERGLESRTWTVVTADHGEEFLERGHFGHTRTLYEELVRVPLIVRGPRGSRVRTPTEVERPVSLVSLMPTILAMAGVETDVAFHGPSLLPILTGAETPPFAPPLFEVDFVPGLEENSENEAHKRGLVTAGFKLIEDMETGDLSLYDLGSDPGETVNLAERRPAVRRRLQAALRRATRRRAQPGPAARDAPLNDEQIERLRELGYIADEM